VRKLIATVALSALAMFVLVGVSSGAPANLKPFASAPNTATVTSSSSATLVTVDTNDAGVYVQAKSLNGKALNKVSFGFTSSGDVNGGAPRFSIPINDGTTVLGYAFMDAANCGGTSGNTTLVSTQNASCKVYFKSGSYDNWTAFAAANPNYKIGSQIPFIIADGTPGTYQLSGIDLH